ncbi:MAG: HNH endonuclease [Bacteroidetes bacterium]|nr:HNH endonuclease [Bacteroidota bacterium]
MKSGQRLWTREELILAINLYCKLPFGKMHQHNPEIIELSGIIARTPGSVALKLGNFASLDPSLQARGIKGAANTSKLDRETWMAFFNNWDALIIESELLLAKYKGLPEPVSENIADDKELIGQTREQVIQARVNQSFFRKSILAAYNTTCCITGLQHPELLVASHIRPWAMDEGNRLNPRNGIAINALHDKAFEAGLMTIDTDYRIRISSKIKKDPHGPLSDYFTRFDHQLMILPTRFLPDPAFLMYHNTERFIP